MVIDAKDIVIRFAGDSGDGMQLTGSLFADMSAIFGNSLSTFPDYPAEIRAPHGTVSGVSGFQVHIDEQISIITEMIIKKKKSKGEGLPNLTSRIIIQ